MLYQRLDDLDEADLESQAEYIRISLELTSENQEKCMNRVYRAEESDQAGMLLLMYALSDRAIQPEVGSAGCADEYRLADRIRRTDVDFSGNVEGYHSYLVENAEKIRKIYTTLKHMLFQ